MAPPQRLSPGRFGTTRPPALTRSFGAALVNAGLKVKRLYRIYNDSLIRRFFRLYVMAWLHRYLDVDFCETRRGNSGKAAEDSDCGGGTMKEHMCKICGNTDGK